MFTGLIQSIGKIESMQHLGGRERRISIAPQPGFKDIVPGESIAVNGACLSVEDFGQQWFQVYASAQTMERTNLGLLRPGSRVNLERALTVGSRLGGHLVNGHVDCLAELSKVQPAGQSTLYGFVLPDRWSRYVVQKGSVCLDGISLTVNHCASGYLEVNVIPATRAETAVADWKPGWQANLEVDIIAKYVENMLAPWTGVQEQDNSQESGGREGLSLEFLRRHGF
ncbi:MAG: riboflavin synthase [Desulfohalobiaceae bacterium]